MEHPKPIAYLKGDHWYNWESPALPKLVEAIKFADGWIFDTVRGWIAGNDPRPPQSVADADDLKTTVDMLVSGWRDVNRQLSVLRRLDAGGHQEVVMRIEKLEENLQGLSSDLHGSIGRLFDLASSNAGRLKEESERLDRFAIELQGKVNKRPDGELQPVRTAHGWKLPRPDGSIFYVFDREPSNGPRP